MMRMTCAKTAVLGFLAGLLGAPATAQYVGSVSYNRPSLNVSERLGTVGGYFTRGGAAFAGSRRDLSAGGIPRFTAGGRGWFPTGSAPFAIRSQSLTFPTRVPYVGEPIWSGIAASESLWMESGMDYATSPVLALGWRPSALPEVRGITPRNPYGQTAFTEYFGLSPSPEEPIAPPRNVSGTLAERLEQQRSVEQKSSNQRALKLVREATTLDLAPAVRREQLSAAHDALLAWRRMDRDDWVPALLDAHIAIECDQITVIVRSLREALERRADVLGPIPDLGEYFGTPNLIETQARRLLTVPVDSIIVPNSLIVRAYLACRVDDLARVREALETFDRITAGKNTDGSAQILRVFLDDELKRRTAAAG